MEKSVFINNPGQLGGINNFGRIYYGSEFCQKLIPSLQDIRTVFSGIGNKKKFTLLTPYTTSEGLDKLKPLFRYLNGQSPRSEVVFNDWGVFNLLRQGYKDIRPVLGRLLTKQRRDPRIVDILLNKQESKRLFDRKSGKTLILIPRKILPSLYEHFKGSVINVPVFQEFLLANNIKRVEIDSLAWDMKLGVNKGIGVSVYSPYAYVTTTRLCGLVNLTYSACGKECRKYRFHLKSVASPLPFYIWGNTVFYKVKLPPEADLRRKGIDRIVCALGSPV